MPVVFWMILSYWRLYLVETNSYFVVAILFIDFVIDSSPPRVSTCFNECFYTELPLSGFVCSYIHYVCRVSLTRKPIWIVILLRKVWYELIRRWLSFAMPVIDITPYWTGYPESNDYTFYFS